MATTLASLVVKVGADVTGVTAGLNTLEKRTRSLKKQFGSVRDSTLSFQTSLRVLAGAAGLAFAAKKVFDLGAAVEETASKFRTVFGPATGDVQAFIDEFGTMAGLTDQMAQDITSTTGAIVQGMGFAGDASAAFAMDITRLSGDLSSFNNIPIEETSRAIQSALTGERESLKRLGIVILETDVQKRAMADTGKTVAASLTQQEKAMATLALITERAGVAVGDLERTQDSSANTYRRIAAEVLNFRDKLATGLMPALGTVLGELGKTSGGLEGLGDEFVRMGPIIEGWAKFAIDAFGFVAKAIAAPFRIAFNLGQMIGHLARIVGNVLVGDFAGAKAAGADLVGEFADMGAVVTGLVGSFDDMRISSAEAWGAVRTGAEEAAAALGGDTGAALGLQEVERVTRELTVTTRELPPALRIVANEYRGFANAGEIALGRLADMGQGLSLGFLDAFAASMTGAKGAISSFVNHALGELARLAVRMAALGFLQSIFSPGMAGAGFVSGLITNLGGNTLSATPSASSSSMAPSVAAPASVSRSVNLVLPPEASPRDREIVRRTLETLEHAYEGGWRLAPDG